MTPTPHGQVPAIQRYKIGYHSDEWGVRSLSPTGIYDDAGPWVRYKDHIAALHRLHAENEALRTQQQECGNTPYDEGPFALAQPVAQRGAADGFFLLLPQRPKPEAPAGTAGLDWDAYSGAQMLAFGRDCSDAAIAALRAQQPAPDYEAGWKDGYKHGAWSTQQPAPATQQAGDVVAYLDVGASGYLDLGAALSEDALQQLPKGRHALVIAGTYGIDGYVAAPQPSPTTKPAPQQEAQQSLTPETGNSVSAKGAAITPESGKPPAEQQATKETSGGFHVWRDISTAPKDGSRFVATGHNYGLYSEVRHICVAQWFRGCWMEASDWNETSELKYLTHWIPLPSPPDDVAAPAEQQAQPDECFPGEPKVAVPQGLISAACFAIRKKRDGGKVLEQLRRYSVGDRSQPLAPQQAAPKAAPGEPDPADIIAGALQISRGHAIEMMREALEAAPQRRRRWLSEQIDQLERKLAIIGVVGVIDGHDVVRRESVLEIARRAALAAQGGE